MLKAENKLLKNQTANKDVVTTKIPKVLKNDVQPNPKNKRKDVVLFHSDRNTGPGINLEVQSIDLKRIQCILV